MTPHDDDRLTRLIGDALGTLPAPRAPHTLLPRVLAEAKSRSAASGHRAVWRHWPGWAQMAAGVAGIAALVALAWFWTGASPGAGVNLLPEPVQQAGRQVDALSSTARDLLQVGVLVWQSIVGPLAKGLFTLTLLLCAACALCAAALGRIALGGAHQS